MSGSTSATTTGNASANDSTCAVRDTAQGTKHRTASDAIKALFAVVKAITQRDDEPEPERRRKKEGESDNGMMQLARQLSRLFAAKPPRAQQAAQVQDVRAEFREERAAITRPSPMPGDFFAAATAHLSDTLAQLHQWNDEALAADFDDSFAIDHKYSSLNL